MDVLPDPDLISLEEAATLMGIGRATAYTLAKQGKLPGALKIGGRWRVSKRKYARAVHGEVA